MELGKNFNQIFKPSYLDSFGRLPLRMLDPPLIMAALPDSQCPGHIYTFKDVL